MKRGASIFLMLFAASLCGCLTHDKGERLGMLGHECVGILLEDQVGETAVGGFVKGFFQLGSAPAVLEPSPRTQGQVPPGPNIMGEGAPAPAAEKYVVCPKCGTMLWLPPEAELGNKIKCGNCGVIFILTD